MHNFKYNDLTLSASSYDRKVSVEIPLDSTSHELFEAFKTLMVGLTYHESSFNDAVVEYFYAHGLDKDE